ncbi:hypothetical protein [uncultured Psychroserpens sp.]|uniref:hypothetical protein n=1 Tax=uncultured Psychroserpens sp. TaxID=255436 RepID=UPI00260B02C8|nr:hypothetical protein [uncultured Psychroserpens sp.]
MPKPKKIFKIIGGVIIFFTLPTLLFFAFMYLKYDEDLPTGAQGKAADQLAVRMLNALNYEAYQATDYIEFTFKKRHHFKWYKTENRCEVYWKNIKVNLDLANHDNSEVFVSEEPYYGEDLHEFIHKAEDLFNNDTFWLVAPYKVFDEGVERRLVKTNNGKDALLVTYTNGGSTPGDSYLWHFDDNGKPKSYQMWVDILPINGLKASWSNWTTTQTEAQLPTFHKLLVIGLEIDDIKTTPEVKTTYYYPYKNFIEEETSKLDVSLDSLDNFNGLIDRLSANCKNEKETILNFKNEAYNFKVMANYNCNVVICHKYRNILQIKNETLRHATINDKPLDSLYKYLHIQATNKGKDPKFSTSKNVVVVQISQDSLTPITQTKAVLIDLLKTFNQINKEQNDSLSLFIDFRKYFITDFPPPPPPPANIEPIHLIN